MNLKAFSHTKNKPILIETQCGDATNLVVVLAGELMLHAEALLKMGLHTADVVSGYSIALKAALKKIEGLFVCS